jgi:hypothetical protein
MTRELSNTMKAIGEEALTRFLNQHLDWIEGHFPKSVILNAEEVRALFEAHKPASG